MSSLIGFVSGIIQDVDSKLKESVSSSIVEAGKFCIVPDNRVIGTIAVGIGWYAPRYIRTYGSNEVIQVCVNAFGSIFSHAAPLYTPMIVELVASSAEIYTYPVTVFTLNTTWKTAKYVGSSLASIATKTFVRSTPEVSSLVDYEDENKKSILRTYSNGKTVKYEYDDNPSSIRNQKSIEFLDAVRLIIEKQNPIGTFSFDFHGEKIAFRMREVIAQKVDAQRDSLTIGNSPGPVPPGNKNPSTTPPGSKNTSTGLPEGRNPSVAPTGKNPKQKNRNLST